MGEGPTTGYAQTYQQKMWITIHSGIIIEMAKSLMLYGVKKIMGKEFKKENELVKKNIHRAVGRQREQRVEDDNQINIKITVLTCNIY